jgi:hypothetical protein
MRERVLPIVMGLASIGFLVSPLPRRSIPLSERIEGKRREVENARHAEAVLTTTIDRMLVSSREQLVAARAGKRGLEVFRERRTAARRTSRLSSASRRPYGRH